MTGKSAATPTPSAPDAAQHDRFAQQTAPVHAGDAEAQLRIKHLTESSCYRKADEDPAFLQRREMCGVRLLLDYWKTEELQQRHRSNHTVVYGSTRLAEPGAARRRLEAAHRALAAAPDDPERRQNVAIAKRLLEKVLHGSVRTGPPDRTLIGDADAAQTRGRHRRGIWHHGRGQPWRIRVRCAKYRL